MTRRFLHMADYDHTIASGERALAIAVTSAILAYKSRQISFWAKHTTSWAVIIRR
jgi:hypothetical protein